MQKKVNKFHVFFEKFKSFFIKFKCETVYAIWYWSTRQILDKLHTNLSINSKITYKGHSNLLGKFIKVSTKFEVFEKKSENDSNLSNRTISVDFEVNSNQSEQWSVQSVYSKSETQCHKMYWATNDIIIAQPRQNG